MLYRSTYKTRPVDILYESESKLQLYTEGLWRFPINILHKQLFVHSITWSTSKQLLTLRMKQKILVGRIPLPGLESCQADTQTLGS